MLFNKPTTDGAVTLTALQARRALLNGKNLRLISIATHPDDRVSPCRGQWPSIIKMEEVEASESPSGQGGIITLVCEDNPRAAWYLDSSTELRVIEQ